MIGYKSTCFIFIGSKFDRSSSLTCKKYLPLPNQFKLWIGHIQIILKRIKFEVQTATAK